jgi:hypothetical protein
MKTAAILMLATSACAFASTINIPAEADTTLQESAPGSSFGARTALQAGTVATARNRALVSFNVGGYVPPGATVIAARVQLTATDSLPTQTFELRRVRRDWRDGAQNGAAAVVNDATWIHRLFPNTTWAAPGESLGTDFAGASSAVLTIGSAGAYRIDSTAALVSDVQVWLDRPEDNCGWMLLAQNESLAQTVRTFAAHEDMTRAPVLEVEYSTDTPGFHTVISGRTGGQAAVNWRGGRAPFQVFTRPELGSGTWSPAAGLVATSSATVNLPGPRGFVAVASEPTAEYDVVFNATWSAATHPTDFPASAH